MKLRQYKELELNELLARFADNPEVFEALLKVKNTLRCEKFSYPGYVEIMRAEVSKQTTASLLQTFCYWEDTPQGHAFWKGIADA